jgi:ribose 1,5-bisphosphokinase PhnN
MTDIACASAAKQPRAGLLVLLSGAEARGKDVLIASARRRYADDPRLEFPARLQTRPSALDSEHIGVPRRVFRDIERNRGFAVSWQHADADHGLTAGALAALDAGRIVVIAVPPAAVDRFRALWPNVEVIPLASEVDAARPSANRCPGTTSVRNPGDIAEAVRRFNRVLDALAQRQFAPAGI